MTHSRLIPLGCTMANAAALHTLLLLLTGMDVPTADRSGLLVWWGCLALAWLGLELWLGRERSVQSVIVILLAVFALQIGVTVALGWRSPTFGGWCAALACWGAVYYRCWAFVRTPATPEQLMLTFETTAFALILSAFFTTNGLMDWEALLHLALATALALMSLALRRTGGGGKASGGRGLLVALPAGVALLSALCAGLFTPGLGRVVTVAEQGLRWGAAALFQAFEDFCLFLVSLLPDEPPMEDPWLEEGGLPSMEGGGGGEMEFLNPDLLFYTLIAAVGVVILLLLIHTLRKGGKWGGKTRRTLPATGRSAGLSPKGLLGRWLAALGFRWRCFTLRNTPMGLLVWLEGRYHRREEESPRAFLNRCAQIRPDCAGELGELADWLDGYYFAPTPPTLYFDPGKVRKKFLRADDIRPYKQD